MHPFSIKTVYAIILAIVSYCICYFLFLRMHGFMAMVLRSIVFMTLYGGTIIYFDLSPDILSVWVNVKNKTYPKRRSAAYKKIE